ncbi:hypothetical protein BD413DRAFT_548891 [Trametes elegans]|nr:hypothetical protein BD413DRAFT_548891 [Trametes elegans]
MSITAKELAYAATSQVFTRSFRHLLPVPRFLVRGPFMPGQPKPKDTKPKDRIKFWNIVPGDYVRVRGDTSGTIREVHKVNKISNRVLLKREVNKAGFVPDSRSGTSISVPYSQCQLLVGRYEYPPEGDATKPEVKPVFASRITMSKPFWDKGGGYWFWRRYAVNTVPRLPNFSPENVVSVRIPWPKCTPVSKPEPGLYDTTEDAVKEVTYTPPALPASLLNPAPRIPSEQEYITSLKKPGEVSLPESAPVEAHVHKELSNPHGRAKKQARWQAAQARQKALLRELVQAEYAKLGGRTHREARADATWKWRNQLEEERKAEIKRRWRDRGGEARLLRTKARKARKAAKREERLRNLVLNDAPNQVVPPSSKAPASA